MNILPELSAIAAAKYGLHLKDPIYKAFDKLVQDSRFELIKNPGVDDYAEFNDKLKTYANRNTTCTTIRYILILIQILNGRKGYYTKKTTTPLEPRDTIFYWIDMLLKEFMNSGNGYSYDNYTRGSGVVNGIKMRAAIYYILDILNCEDALYADAVTSGVMPSPYFFMGRDITQIVIHGTASGVGTLDTTDGKYYVDVEIYNILKDVTTTLNICLGDSALGEGDTHTITSPTYSNYGDSFYRVTVKDFNCDIETNYTLTRENEITPGAVKEKTGTPPMKFYTVDTSLLDWVINGAAGGVGKPGKNYLKPRLEAIPNGSIGIANSNSGWQNLINGYTFYSDTSTVLTITFKSNSDNDIHPSDIADVMLIEGSTIPSVYDSETNLFIKDIYQGSVSAYDINSTGSSQKINQAVYATPDTPYANTVSFLSNKRCYNYQMTLSPNTYYSIRIFNSTVNDIVGGILLINPLVGTVTPTITSCSAYTQKSIPSNGTFVANTEQWIRLNYTQNYTREYYYSLPLDARPLLYKYCDHYATLKAGTYKVMIDTWGNNRFWGTGGYWTGISDYTGCMEDNLNYDQLNNIYEWFGLVEENDTVIIPKSKLLPDDIGSKMVKIEGATLPLPNYFHKEITFTIDHDCKVGLIHKAYYNSVSEAEEAYFRFMIVDSDVEAVYFETTGADPAQMQGYSAWEKYQVKVSVVVYNNAVPGEAALWVKKDIPVDDFLYDGDSVSLTSSSVDITTFEGWNSIVVDSDVQPTIYIKYQQ